MITKESGNPSHSCLSCHLRLIMPASQLLYSRSTNLINFANLLDHPPTYTSDIHTKEHNIYIRSKNGTHHQYSMDT
jgi:hypothetical protein